MNYVQVTLFLPAYFSEIFMAELSELGYESFVETDENLEAYITEDIFSEEKLQEIIKKYNSEPIHYKVTELEKKNWNEEWEKNYEPVRVDKTVLIRASFHETENFPYEIVINPKMSFGTGHHETTELMIKNQLCVLHTGKTVLDVGCGTGILAIMAAKLGATEIDAIDIEDWAVENTNENKLLNNCPFVNALLGKIEDVTFDKKFDIILANINRNILLSEIPRYTGLLKDDGYLIISGFYETDIHEIEKLATSVFLRKENQLLKNNWASVIFKK